MKFCCEKALLLNGVNTAARAVAAKSSVPALEGILLEAGAEGLRMTGFNLELGIYEDTEAEVTESGAVVLNARLLGELLRRLPDETVIVETEEEAVRIRCGRSEFNLLGIPADEFPELPQVDDRYSVALEERTLREMIEGTLFAASTNEARPIYTGALFDLEGDRLTLVAVDGYRLALRRVSGLPESSPTSFVIPGSALDHVGKILQDREDLVTVTVGAKHAMFVMGGAVLITRRLEGEFLDYKKVVPKEQPIRFKVDVQQLRESVERVSLIINEKMKSPIRCVFGTGIVSLSAATALGTAADQCAIDGDGKDTEIGFNNRYLIDALRHSPASRVQVELASGIAPCLMTPEDGGDWFLYMVLPVRLRAEM